MKKALRLTAVSSALSATITAGLMNSIDILPVVAIALAVFATSAVVAILAVLASK